MRSLDRCTKCRLGTMRNYKAKTIGSRRTRYLRCDHCKETSKEIVQVDERGRQVYVCTSPGKQVIAPEQDGGRIQS